MLWMKVLYKRQFMYYFNLNSGVQKRGNMSEKVKTSSLSTTVNCAYMGTLILCLVCRANNDFKLFLKPFRSRPYLLHSHTVLKSPVTVESKCERQLAWRARQRFTERETKRELCQVSKAIGPFSDMIWTSCTKSEAGTA